MCKLPTRLSGLRNILRCLYKRKGITWFKTQEKCVLPGSKKNSRVIHRRKQLRLRCTERGHNQSRQQYRTLVEKSIPLETNDWLKFQGHLKKLHSTEVYQAPVQQWVRNGERSNKLVQVKTLIGSTTSTGTTPKSGKSPTKQLLHKSAIRSQKSVKDRIKILSPKKPAELKQNPLAPKLGKYNWTPKWTMKNQEAHSKCPQSISIQPP